MKFLIISLFTFTSIVALAEENINVYTEKGYGESMLLGSAGCGQAKKHAIELAKESCFQAGNFKCKIVNTKELTSVKCEGHYDQNPFFQIIPTLKLGTCYVSATAEGSN